MPLSLKRDAWKVKDPISGDYRTTAILSTTLPDEVDQIIGYAQEELDEQELRAASIIEDTSNAIRSIDGQRNNILESIASIAGQGTDTSLSTSGVAADAAACGELKADLDQIICKETNDGNYILKCTINNGIISYIWELEN